MRGSSEKRAVARYHPGLASHLPREHSRGSARWPLAHARCLSPRAASLPAPRGRRTAHPPAARASRRTRRRRRRPHATRRQVVPEDALVSEVAGALVGPLRAWLIDALTHAWAARRRPAALAAWLHARRPPARVGRPLPVLLPARRPAPHAGSSVSVRAHASVPARAVAAAPSHPAVHTRRVSRPLPARARAAFDPGSYHCGPRCW